MTQSSQRTYTIVLASLLAIAAILTGANAALAQQSSTLPAPTLTAEPADHAVNLTWTEVAGAVRYELFSWLDEETGWQQIGGDDLTGASYTHSNLVAGVTYFYQIRAVNADDENGEWSDLASAETPAALDAPVLTAQAAAGSVKLTWPAVDTAVRYVLWSWWDEETGWQQIGGDDLTGASYTHSELAVGTTYFYQMRALNAAGESSGLSQQVSATVTEAQQSTSTPTPTATSQSILTATPTPPQTSTPTSTPALTATPTSTPDSSTTATPTLTPETILTATPTLTPETILTATPTLTSESMPTDAPTPTPTSTPTTTITPTLSPSATPTPTATAGPLPAPSLTAELTGVAVKLSWDAVAGAARYELWYWTNADGWHQVGGDNLTATTFTHNELEIGKTYFYTVRAVNSANTVGEWSDQVPVTVTAPPSATPTPTSAAVPLSAPALSVQATEDVIELSWDVVPGAVRYVLWTWTDYGGLQRLDNGALTASTFTHQGVTAGTTYHYTMRAVNSADDGGPWSPWVPATLPGPLTLTPAQIFEKVSPAIAYVESETGSGSGFLIEGGYLVTAAHVVWPYNAVRVVFPDGTEFEEVAVTRLDLVADLAVLGPLDVSIEPLTMIDGENIPIGSRVHLIGYPGEYELFPQPTITGGILSRLRQWEPGPLTLIQTDATIFGGQSGGALVSATGDVIGISNFKIYGEFGLVISSTDIMPRIQQLIAGQDPGGHGDRRLSPPGGALRHSLTLENYWDDQAYVIYAPPRAEFGFSLLGTNDSEVSIYDFLGVNGETFDTFEITGFEYGAYIFGRLTPHFLIVRQKATTPGNFVVAANYNLVPVNDPDSGQTIQVGQSINGNIDFPTDADYFFLDLQQGQTVEILAQSILADMFLTLSIGGSPTLTISRDDGAGLLLRDSRLVIRAPFTGRYYLIVETFEPEAPGGYILTVKPFSVN